MNPYDSYKLPVLTPTGHAPSGYEPSGQSTVEPSSQTMTSDDIMLGFTSPITTAQESGPSGSVVSKLKSAYNNAVAYGGRGDTMSARKYIDDFDGLVSKHTAALERIAGYTGNVKERQEEAAFAKAALDGTWITAPITNDGQNLTTLSNAVTNPNANAFLEQRFRQAKLGSAEHLTARAEATGDPFLLSSAHQLSAYSVSPEVPPEQADRKATELATELAVFDELTEAGVDLSDGRFQGYYIKASEAGHSDMGAAAASARQASKMASDFGISLDDSFELQSAAIKRFESVGSNRAVDPRTGKPSETSPMFREYLSQVLSSLSDATNVAVTSGVTSSSDNDGVHLFKTLTRDRGFVEFFNRAFAEGLVSGEPGDSRRIDGAVKYYVAKRLSSAGVDFNPALFDGDMSVAKAMEVSDFLGGQIVPPSSVTHLVDDNGNVINVANDGYTPGDGEQFFNVVKFLSGAMTKGMVDYLPADSGSSGDIRSVLGDVVSDRRVRDRLVDELSESAFGLGVEASEAIVDSFINQVGRISDGQSSFDYSAFYTDASTAPVSAADADSVARAKAFGVIEELGRKPSYSLSDGQKSALFDAMTSFNPQLKEIGEAKVSYESADGAFQELSGKEAILSSFDDQATLVSTVGTPSEADLYSSLDGIKKTVTANAGKTQESATSVIRSVVDTLEEDDEQRAALEKTMKALSSARIRSLEDGDGAPGQGYYEEAQELIQSSGLPPDKLALAMTALARDESGIDPNFMSTIDFVTREMTDTGKGTVIVKGDSFTKTSPITVRDLVSYVYDSGDSGAVQTVASLIYSSMYGDEETARESRSMLHSIAQASRLRQSNVTSAAQVDLVKRGVGRTLGVVRANVMSKAGLSKQDISAFDSAIETLTELSYEFLDGVRGNVGKSPDKVDPKYVLDMVRASSMMSATDPSSVSSILSVLSSYAGEDLYTSGRVRQAVNDLVYVSLVSNGVDRDRAADEAKATTAALTIKTRLSSVLTSARQERNEAAKARIEEERKLRFWTDVAINTTATIVSLGGNLATLGSAARAVVATKAIPTRMAARVLTKSAAKKLTRLSVTAGIPGTAAYASYAGAYEDEAVSSWDPTLDIPEAYDDQISAGSGLSRYATNMASLAVAGAFLGGGVGALIGAGIGLGVTAVTDLINWANRPDFGEAELNEIAPALSSVAEEISNLPGISREYVMENYTAKANEILRRDISPNQKAVELVNLMKGLVAYADNATSEYVNREGLYEATSVSADASFDRAKEESNRRELKSMYRDGGLAKGRSAALDVRNFASSASLPGTDRAFENAVNDTIRRFPRLPVDVDSKEAQAEISQMIRRGIDSMRHEFTDGELFANNGELVRDIMTDAFSIMNSTYGARQPFDQKTGEPVPEMTSREALSVLPEAIKVAIERRTGGEASPW